MLVGYFLLEWDLFLLRGIAHRNGGTSLACPGTGGPQHGIEPPKTGIPQTCRGMPIYATGSKLP